MRSKLLNLTFTFVITTCFALDSESGGTAAAATLGAGIHAATASRAFAGVTYTVTNLGTFGGVSSSGNSINDRAWVTGNANLPGDTVTHAALWQDDSKLDLGTLGGANSAVAWPNNNLSGLIAGISETPAVDPLGENWSCSAFFPTVTQHVCLGFAWRRGSMSALSTLGGVNGYASGTNFFGQIVGWAETTTHDTTCTPPQVLRFEPVIWRNDWFGGGYHIAALPTFEGDPDGAATAINDLGQIVGISGTCDQAVGRFTAAHAVLWQYGKVINLGSFGGVSWNTPTDINDRGEVVGFANLPGDTSGQLQPHAFLWTAAGGMKDLGTLPGDVYSFAEGINNRGQVVGISYGAGFATARAFIWQNNVMTDLNTLIPSGSPLYLLVANSINDWGEITGQALVQGTAQTPAYLATPNFGGFADTKSLRKGSAAKVILPRSVRQQLLRRLGVRL